MPEKAIINGQECELIKSENIYKSQVNIDSNSGVKNIIIEKIILNNGKAIEISRDNTIQIEVLKEKPIIEAFTYTETEDNKIKASFKLIDEEQTITTGNIIITDEKENQIATQQLNTDINEISFNKVSSETYKIKVVVNYDLDTNKLETGKNEYQNEVLLVEEMNISSRMLEMKDIETISLYKQDGTKVTKLNIAELDNLENYLVKVEMKALPAFYSGIKEYKVEDDVLKFVLDYDRVVQYNGNQKHDYIEVEYGPVDEAIANQSDLSLLIEQIKANPYGDYKIVSDLDASKITEGQAVILETFYGTLDGNGHTIKNLSRPLFETLNGANIKNLVIEAANMRAYGVLTVNMTATTVKNVHFNNITLTAPGTAGTGILAGVVNQNSLIEECSATNITVGTAKILGGFIGKMTNSTIRNSYISKGTVSSNSDGCGGFIGETLTGCTVENCYANISTNYASSGGSRGGFIGNPVNTILNNNLSVSISASGDGKGSRVFGKYQYNISGSSKNNYELATSNLTSNASHSAVSEVEENTLKTQEFYKETLKWEESIWNFNNVTKGEYPTLKNADPNNEEKDTPSNEELYIPDYTRLKKLSDYDTAKEIAYHNLYKLMPFYDAKYYVEDANRISVDNILNTKLIEAIVPLDSNNKMLVNLTNKTKQNIAKIKIIFTDGTIQDYEVTYKENIGNIATYKIEALGIEYSYNKYLLIEESDLINSLVSKIENYTFDNNLNSITSEDEDMRYKENFDNIVRKNAKEFIINLLANVPEYNISLESQILENKVKLDLEEGNQLEKLLVAYNYFDRMYKTEIGGVIVRDTLFFDGSMFEGKLNPIVATNEFLASSYRATNQTVNYYTNTIKITLKKIQ